MPFAISLSINYPSAKFFLLEFEIYLILHLNEQLLSAMIWLIDFS